MNYQEAVEYIESLAPTLERPGLERFAMFMAERGKLQDRCASLHVAGTNGKGSVATMLAETLNRAGLVTGKYTGPHLFSFTERCQVGGRNIPDDQFAAICSELKEQSEDFGKKHPEHGALSWFELITACAFVYFQKAKTDASVFEVGLGGRFDATNVLSAPLVTAIVTVGLDHMHLLGENERLIAAEKAGILKPGVPVVTACRGDALDVILQAAKEKAAPVICVSGESLAAGSGSARELDYIAWLQKRFAELPIPINKSLANRGGYQQVNARVAAAALGIFEQESGKKCLEHFDSALSALFWPGRLQYFQKHNLLLDAAHNLDGARALRESLDELFPKKSRCYILCFYQSKQFEEFLEALLRPGDMVFASQTTGRRPVVAAELIVEKAIRLGAQSQSFPGMPEAFQAAFQAACQPLLMIGTGSFASVTAGLRFLGYDNAEDSRSASSNLWHTTGA